MRTVSSLELPPQHTTPHVSNPHRKNERNRKKERRKNRNPSPNKAKKALTALRLPQQQYLHRLRLLLQRRLLLPQTLVDRIAHPLRRLLLAQPLRPRLRRLVRRRRPCDGQRVDIRRGAHRACGGHASGITDLRLEIYFGGRPTKERWDLLGNVIYGRADRRSLRLQSCSDRKNEHTDDTARTSLW